MPFIQGKPLSQRTTFDLACGFAWIFAWTVAIVVPLTRMLYRLASEVVQRQF